jgi:drug/metabolite transporter (DMT)-like permease
VPRNGPPSGPVTAPPPPLKVVGALAVVYVVWGSTYLAIRVMVEDVPPLLGAGTRFLLAGALLYAWVAAKRPGPKVSRRELAGCAVVGTLLTFGGNGLVTVAERDVPSGLAALLIASVPLWVIVLRALWGEHPRRATALGVIAGFVGVAVLLAPGQRPEGVGLGACLLVVLAAMCWASGSFAGSRVQMPSDPLRSTALQMLCGGAVMTAVAIPAGEPWALQLGAISADAWLAFAFLVFIGSIVAFSAYAWLLRNVAISTVATYAYVNPVIAVVLGAVILSEPVHAATLAGMAIIVASVAYTMRVEGTERRSETAAVEAHRVPPRWATETSAGRTASG